MTVSNFSRRAILAAALVSASYGSAAFAQTTAQVPDDIGQEVIVTGTRTTGMKAIDSPSPVVVLGADALKRVGQTDINSILAQQVPTIQSQAFGNDQTAFHPSIKLRGLNPNHTLVMVNGKRRHGTANVVVTNALWTGGAAPDLGLIPSSSIGDVQILLDGAAAQYGTDAIAGVVNIILKKDTHGGNIDLTAGQYFAGDGKTWDAMGRIALAPVEDSYLDITAERKYKGYSFRGDLDPRVVDTGVAAAANTGNNGGRTILARFPGVRNFKDYPYVNKIFGDGKMQLTNVMYNAGYTGINNIEIYSFGSYSRRIGRTFQNYRLPNVVYGKSVGPTAQGGANSINSTANGCPATGFCDIPFPSGFAPQEVLRETDYSIAGGAKGSFGDTTFDLSAVYGRDYNGIYVERSANAALYYDTSTLTTAGYSPSNVFDGAFVASQITVNLDLTHKLDLGLYEPITIAGGIEHRRENYQLRAGEVASYYVGSGVLAGGIQSFFGYSPANASSNDRRNWSEYLDISAKPIEGWLVDGAVRHEKYSDFGSTTIFKLTSRYDISPAIAVRGTVSTGFRAPTLAEGFYSGINVSVASLSGIFAPNSTGARALGLSGLKPEKSTNFSAGLVLKPIPRLNITIDGYMIKLRDRIVQSGGFTGYSNNCRYLPGGYTAGANLQSIYDAYKAANPASCTGIVSPNVLAALAGNGVPIQSVITTINGGATGSLAINSFVNGVNTRTSGIDFMANYMTPLPEDLGRVDWMLAMNYNKTKVTKLAPPPANVNQTQPVVDKYAQSFLTSATPKFRATFGANWSWKFLEVNLRESYYGNSGFLTTFPSNGNQDVFIKAGTAFITDLEVTAKIGSGIRLSLGANNLFNKYPKAYPDDFRASQYALSSTAFITKYPVTSPFGVMGGYYYARASFKF